MPLNEFVRRQGRGIFGNGRREAQPRNATNEFEVLHAVPDAPISNEPADDGMLGRVQQRRLVVRVRGGLARYPRLLRRGIAGDDIRTARKGRQAVGDRRRDHDVVDAPQRAQFPAVGQLPIAVGHPPNGLEETSVCADRRECRPGYIIDGCHATENTLVAGARERPNVAAEALWTRAEHRQLGVGEVRGNTRHGVPQFCRNVFQSDLTTPDLGGQMNGCRVRAQTSCPTR